tara:strand:+ start:1222 stop:1701 length:480 start_codon:yes stop_codon:yes gene_type:complete
MMRYLIILSLVLLFPHYVLSEEYEAVVLKVIDGDTIYIKSDNGRKKVRLRHIDAPEIRQSYGKEAKIFLDKQIDGKKIIVNSDYKDRYGRDIGDIFVYNNDEAIYINAKLVKSGHAWVYKSYRKNTYLMNLENFARENMLGLWKDKSAIEPWEFRSKNK